MSQETTNLAILFADISGSTLIYETLGDSAAQRMITNCLSVLAKVVEQHQGKVVKTVGDELLCVFPDAMRAVEAAKALQQTLEHTSFEEWPGSVPPSIHAGIHFGPVIQERGDVFGDAVNIAARVVSLAKARQIFVTEQTLQALTPEIQASVRWVDRATVKGKREALEVYEVIWEWEELTSVFRAPRAPLALQSNMELRFREQAIQVDASRVSITLGRHPSNDLMVDDHAVSRTHARVEYRGGSILLTDQSTNGTYVCTRDSKEQTMYVHRSEIRLQGSGFICLGRLVEEDSAKTIHFTCEPEPDLTFDE